MELAINYKGVELLIESEGDFSLAGLEDFLVSLGVEEVEEEVEVEEDDEYGEESDY